MSIRSTRIRYTALPLFALLLAQGCATVVHGPRQKVSLSSKPEDVRVSVDGSHLGTTPLTSKIPRKGPHVIEFTKDGYETESIHVASSYEPQWLLANGIFVFGWPLGLLVDHVAGSPYSLDRDNFHVDLTRTQPTSFYKTMEPAWAIVELREGVQDEDAWNKVRDILIRKFDIEVIEREDGYLRTGWLYTWTGEYRADYRVRVTVKFQTPEKKIEIKTEAQYGREGQWIQGYDTGLLSLIKTDIMGGVGKVTR